MAKKFTGDLTGNALSATHLKHTYQIPSTYSTHSGQWIKIANIKPLYTYSGFMGHLHVEDVESAKLSGILEVFLRSNSPLTTEPTVYLRWISLNNSTYSDSFALVKNSEADCSYDLYFIAKGNFMTINYSVVLFKDNKDPNASCFTPITSDAVYESPQTSITKSTLKNVASSAHKLSSTAALTISINLIISSTNSFEP